MPRFALFTAECAQLGPALQEVIERHRDQLGLVVTSRLSGGKRPGLVRQTLTNYRRSGPEFLTYLVCSFVLYFRFIAVERLRSRITGRPRRRYSVAELCDRYGIPHLETDDVNGEAVAAALRDAAIDHIVIYWFDQIIHDHVIRSAPRGVINLHAAYLPNCRGLFPGFWSAARCDTFGITAHVIEDRQIDAGPILDQVQVAVPPGRSVLYADYCVNRAGVELLDMVLANVDHLSEHTWQPGPGTYYSYPTRQDVRDARRRGIRLITLRDFLDVCTVPSTESPAPSTLAKPEAVGVSASE
jgi:methionyl-tRNA formyltransferase